jgi:hypothetical protein
LLSKARDNYNTRRGGGRLFGVGGEGERGKGEGGWGGSWGESVGEGDVEDVEDGDFNDDDGNGENVDVTRYDSNVCEPDKQYNKHPNSTNISHDNVQCVKSSCDTVISSNDSICNTSQSILSNHDNLLEHSYNSNQSNISSNCSLNKYIKSPNEDARNSYTSKGILKTMDYFVRRSTDYLDTVVDGCENGDCIVYDDVNNDDNNHDDNNHDDNNHDGNNHVGNNHDDNKHDCKKHDDVIGTSVSNYDDDDDVAKRRLEQLQAELAMLEESYEDEYGVDVTGNTNSSKQYWERGERSEHVECWERAENAANYENDVYDMDFEKRDYDDYYNNADLDNGPNTRESDDGLVLMNTIGRNDDNFVGKCHEEEEEVIIQHDVVQEEEDDEVLVQEEEDEVVIDEYEQAIQDAHKRAEELSKAASCNSNNDNDGASEAAQEEEEEEEMELIFIRPGVYQDPTSGKFYCLKDDEEGEEGEGLYA